MITKDGVSGSTSSGSCITENALPWEEPCGEWRNGPLNQDFKIRQFKGGTNAECQSWPHHTLHPHDNECAFQSSFVSPAIDPQTNPPNQTATLPCFSVTALCVDGTMDRMA